MTSTIDSTRLSTLADQRTGRLLALVAMARPSQIALILLVLLDGLLLGLWRGGEAAGAADMTRFGWAAILVIVTAAAVHLANEAADHRTDRLTERTPFSGGSGALRASGLSPRVPLRWARALALVVVLSGAASVASGALPAAAGLLLLAGLAGGLAYSLRPVAAMRRGWGEALNALLGAMLLPLLGVAVANGAVGALDVIAFLPFLLVTVASVMATAWLDRDADAATGKATLQVRLAPRALRRIQLGAGAGFVAATLLSAAVDAMPLALAGLLIAPLLVVGWRDYTRRRTPLASVAAMVGLALIALAGLAVSLAA